jgi:hypothetical protein
MVTLYICGSFRFIHEITELERRLKKEGIKFLISKKKDNRGILGCLEKIDEADVVYVVNPNGYVGRSVCIDIGYAYAKGKPVYVMHPIDDLSIMKMVKGILSFEELISFLKHRIPSKGENVAI